MRKPLVVVVAILRLSSGVFLLLIVLQQLPAVRRELSYVENCE